MKKIVISGVFVCALAVYGLLTLKAATALETKGTRVVNTTKLAKNVQGYRGQTPLEITFKNGKIAAIKALKNNETPQFFGKAFKHLSEEFVGKTARQAATMKVDAVSGATYSSKAIIENIHRGAAYYNKQK